jgi:hypothetical protein
MLLTFSASPHREATNEMALRETSLESRSNFDAATHRYEGPAGITAEVLNVHIHHRQPDNIRRRHARGRPDY